MTSCPTHPRLNAVETCVRCDTEFCIECVVIRGGETVCRGCEAPTAGGGSALSDEEAARLASEHFVFTRRMLTVEIACACAGFAIGLPTESAVVPGFGAHSGRVVLVVIAVFATPAYWWWMTLTRTRIERNTLERIRRDEAPRRRGPLFIALVGIGALVVAILIAPYLVPFLAPWDRLQR